MASATGKNQCTTCGKEKSAVRCEGCLQIFCYNHLTEHRQQLNQQLDEIEVNRDIFRQTLTQQIIDSKNHVLIKQIDQWEKVSIKKIQQIAQESRQLLDQYTSEHMNLIEIDLNKLTEELRKIRQDEDINEIDLIKFKEKLRELENELGKPSNISIQEDLSSPINKISVIISSHKELSEKSLQQQQLDQLNMKPNAENELLPNEIKILRKKLNEMKIDKETYMNLNAALIQVEKVFLRYQRATIEVKRQLAGYQSFINDLQREIQALTERLSVGAEEYKILFRKYTLLESSKQLNLTETSSNEITFNEEEFVSILHKSYGNQQAQDKETVAVKPPTVDTDEVQICPMCSWVFPVHMTLDEKTKHIENHFQ